MGDYISFTPGTKHLPDVQFNIVGRHLTSLQCLHDVMYRIGKLLDWLDPYNFFYLIQ